MAQQFETTAWSVIAAAKGSDSDLARRALAALCERYWSPLYSFLRYKGYPRDEAEELTQEFFAQMLARDFLQYVGQDLGRFRSFMLASLENFLLDARKLQAAAKRGGRVQTLSMDFDQEERRLAPGAKVPPDPYAAFDRQWAESLMEAAVSRLEREYRTAGRGRDFEVLQQYLVAGDAKQDYATVAEALDKTEGAVKVAVHRLRKRFGTLVRQEIAQTVEKEEDIKEELEYLIQVMST